MNHAILQMLILGSESHSCYRSHVKKAFLRPVVFLAPPGGVDKLMHSLIISRLLIVLREYEMNPSSLLIVRQREKADASLFSF